MADPEGAAGLRSWHESSAAAPQTEEEYAVSPFSVTIKPAEDLNLVRKHRKSLRRAGNEMPFWDDLKLAALPELAGRLVLFDAFERPERFRFSMVGCELTQRYGEGSHRSIHERIEPRIPFNYVTSQYSVAVEGRAPTYYEHIEPREHQSVGPSYARILLPLWGEGSVRMLLGAVVTLAPERKVGTKRDDYRDTDDKPGDRFLDFSRPPHADRQVALRDKDANLACK